VSWFPELAPAVTIKLAEQQLRHKRKESSQTCPQELHVHLDDEEVRPKDMKWNVDDGTCHRNGVQA